MSSNKIGLDYGEVINLTNFWQWRLIWFDIFEEKGQEISKCSVKYHYKFESG